MLENIETLPISGVNTLTEIKEINNVRDITFSIKGEAATYTVQISLDGVEFVEAVAGTAVSLNIYTLIFVKDIHVKYVRISLSLATTAVIKYLVRY